MVKHLTAIGLLTAARLFGLSAQPSPGFALARHQAGIRLSFDQCVGRDQLVHRRNEIVCIYTLDTIESAPFVLRLVESDIWVSLDPLEDFQSTCARASL